MAVVDDLVFLQGVGATKQTLRRWNESPWRVIRPWIAWSAAVALALLAGTYAVATISTRRCWVTGAVVGACRNEFHRSSRRAASIIAAARSGT